jgi:heme A synthase
MFLIMSRRILNLFLFLQGTHVHHLNYGIFLLAAVGAYTLFRRPDGRPAEIAALAYGIALVLLCQVLTSIFGLPCCPHAMEPKAMAAQPGSVC